MTRRYRLLLLFAVFSGLLVFIIQKASTLLVSPERRELQHYHQEILAAPGNHGMDILPGVAPNRTPFLICKPNWDFISQKGQRLRVQLSERGHHDFSSKDVVILMLHGHGGRKEDHLPIAERFCSAGFTCLLPDLPAHGEHPATIGTFGHHEVAELADLIHFGQTHFELPEKVALFGISQGAAISLQLASSEPDSICAVAALSSFASLSETMQQSARALKFLTPLVELNLRIRHGFNPRTITPEKSAQSISIPTFIAHGQLDPLIPSSHARRIFDNLATEEKTLTLVADANHDTVLIEGHQIYADLVEFFLKNS